MSGDGGERPPPEEGRAWEKPQQMVVRDKARMSNLACFETYGRRFYAVVRYGANQHILRTALQGVRK